MKNTTILFGLILFYILLVFVNKNSFAKESNSTKNLKVEKSNQHIVSSLLSSENAPIIMIKKD